MKMKNVKKIQKTETTSNKKRNGRRTPVQYSNIENHKLLYNERKFESFEQQVIYE